MKSNCAACSLSAQVHVQHVVPTRLIVVLVLVVIAVFAVITARRR